MTQLFGTDVRAAARALWRTPTITICAVLCLALGLGATTAIASAIDRALIRALPFRDPARLVSVYRIAPQATDWPFSVPKYLDLARGVKQFTGLSALGWSSRLVAMPDGGVQMRTIRVTGNLFPLLGVRALRGRLINSTDDSAGQNPVVVMGEEAWREHFSADPSIIGRTVRLDGIPTTVIGILPAGFRVPHGLSQIHGDLWVPIRFTPEELAQRGHNFLNVVGRLAPGATVASGTAELHSLVDAMVEKYPELRGESARATAMQSDSVNTIRTPLLLVFAAVCVVLLIAAANVGSLLLARGVRRQREMAVRTALGGSQWAVMRPAITEGALLALVGGLVGIGLAWIAVRSIGNLASEQLPQLTGLSIEIRIVLFAVALSTIVALLCSALPAWYSANIDPQDALRGERTGGGGLIQKRALGTLVALEVALSLILLIGASLVLRGFQSLIHRDPGFDPRTMLTVTATISPERYTDSTTVSRFLVPALQAIERVPGVQSAGAISLLPFREWGSNSNIRYEGQPGNDMEHLPLADDRDATPDFFHATGQRLIAGRLLRYDDDLRRGLPIVVVANEALVRRDFPHSDPIGKRFYVGDSTFATIVGVVSDIANAGPFDQPLPEVYWSYSQLNGVGETLFPIVVRVSGDPVHFGNAVRAAIHEVDPVAAISDVGPMTNVISKSVGAPRFYLLLLGSFALVALILALAGLYGVMSYSVAQRTRELGIRTALGSPIASTLQMVTKEGMRLVGVGVAAGILGGALATRLLQSLLYGVSPADATTWLVATGSLVLAGLLATFIPAYRATRVDPVIAIKVE